MNSFSWKRKRNCEIKPAPLFSNDTDDQTEEHVVNDWRSLLPHKRIMLEDKVSKSNRLIDEGASLADEYRYWEAIAKFKEAFMLTPKVAKIYEMQAQALLEVGELVPAVKAAEQAIEVDPLWAEAHQTLGRSLISIGEIDMALKSFCRAYYLNPTIGEIYSEDICWAQELIKERSKQAESLNASKLCVCSCGSDKGHSNE